MAKRRRRRRRRNPKRAWWEIPLTVGAFSAIGYFALRWAMGAQDPIGKWAGQFGIPRHILAGVVRTESGGKSKAKNLTGGDAARGGAWGLAQMTLATAQELVPKIRRQFPDYAKVLDRFDGTGPSLFNKDLNLLLASYKLATDYAALGGDWEMAVLAYNRGRQGARDYLGDPMTALYVQRVFAA